MITYNQTTNIFYIEDEAYVDKNKVDAMLKIPHKDTFRVKIKSCDCIDKDAFSDIRNITAVFFDNVEAIDERAFRGCKNLLSATFEKVIHISARAFMHTGLQGILLPKSLNYIGIDAFACTELKKVSFANNEADPCLFINSRAFADIKYMKEFKMPRQLKMLGNKVFERTEIEQFSVDTDINFNAITGLYGAFTDANIHTLALCKGLSATMDEYTVPDEKMLIEILKESFDISELF